MIRILQILSTLIVLGVAPIVASDCLWGDGFLDKFMRDQSLSIMGTILAIYIAAAASFLAIIMGFEKEDANIRFNSTASEIKQNICFIIAVFIIHLLLLSGSPNEKLAPQWLLILMKSLKTFTFLIYIYALYELSVVLFGIRETVNKHRKK